jgi:hypothetical protein
MNKLWRKYRDQNLHMREIQIYAFQRQYVYYQHIHKQTIKQFEHALGLEISIDPT